MKLARLTEALKPAVLHAASDFRNALVALEVGKAFDIPVVYEARGFWEETWASGHGPDAYTRDAYRLRRECELQCMKRADRVVTLAEVMKAELVERGVSADKIAVVPNAVDVELFQPLKRDRRLARKLGIKRDELVLGYVSSFSSYEGIRFLIKATAILIERGYRVRCLLVGDGNDREQLESEVAALGLANSVIFTGRVPYRDVLPYYGLIDVFVVPRTADRVSQLVTPLKPYEAMATGRALVVSNVQALREIVIEGETGLFFTTEDPLNLADTIEPLLKDKEHRERLGRAARDWVVANRTWQHVGQFYRELYRTIEFEREATRGNGQKINGTIFPNTPESQTEQGEERTSGVAAKQSASLASPQKQIMPPREDLVLQPTSLKKNVQRFFSLLSAKPMPLMEGRPVVCMFVRNRFQHDARVTREALALIEKGFAVTIFAVHVHDDEPLEWVGPIRVVRLNLSTPVLRLAEEMLEFERRYAKLVSRWRKSATGRRVREAKFRFMLSLGRFGNRVDLSSAPPATSTLGISERAARLLRPLARRVSSTQTPPTLSVNRNTSST
ncbi:MAG: glycosyltransferase family 4 protein, partial [Acidobacteriota bacterium]|nr:glycosyltransferase family 4 protein [Acidobacteriota bacterium]